LIENKLLSSKSFVILKMKFITGKATINQLQWLVWLAVFLIIFFSLLPEDGFYEAGIFSFINVSFYAVIIYGNIKFLYPRFYQTGHAIVYGVLAFVFISMTGLGRGFLIETLYNKYFATKPEIITTGSVINFMVAGFLTYLLSFIFRIAIAYFSLKQQSEKILAQKSQAELNLLKSQVQPHFLFNTLNNIYYEAYREAPRTAKLIERLSDIMRYFVDESPKDEVSLTTEIHFLENYIALEKIRIRHEIELNFIQECNADLRIPPMLLMTFVENIFKHGIDKSSSANKIELSLVQQNNYLIFQTKNQVHEKAGATESTGFGIKNLGKRLELLYGSYFELNITQANGYFTAFLKVPLL
jgi:sensor histidine kinase YesM